MKTIEQPEIDWIKGLATIHFLSIEETDYKTDGMEAVNRAYIRALVKAEKFGGKKVHCHSYGGGLGFDSEAKAIECFNYYNKNK